MRRLVIAGMAVKGLGNFGGVCAGLAVPLRVKMMGWKAVRGGLATKSNIARRLRSVDSRCSLCGFPEDNELHALLECPFAKRIWECNDIDRSLWAQREPDLWTWLESVLKEGREEAMEEVLTMAWAVWGARNKTIFDTSSPSPSQVVENAWSYLKAFKENQPQVLKQGSTTPRGWRPPNAGCWKLNTDAGKLGDWDRGYVFVIRDCEGDIVTAGTQQQAGALSPEIHEATALLFGIKKA
ncbi:hypothetical protein RDABS01_009077 [Bienertia sinuspersici]